MYKKDIIPILNDSNREKSKNSLEKAPNNTNRKTFISSDLESVINTTYIIEISNYYNGVFDSVNWTTLRKTCKLNKALYLFDLENEFGEATNNSGSTNSPSLNAFVEFANMEALSMPRINSLCLISLKKKNIK